MTNTIADARRAGRARLGDGDNASHSPDLDTDVLLCHVLDCRRSALIAYPERALTGAQQRAFESAIERRVRGEPVAYITGTREFWSMVLAVSPATLIPRPDTETLVETALALIDPGTSLRVLDLGTGSGAIALAIASERPQAIVLATDVSTDALAMARKNGERHAPERIDWRPGRWWDAVAGEGPFDVIVSNPPYIRDQDPHLGRGDLRFEPAGALRSGSDGLDDLRTIVSGAPQFLHPGGALIVEHGADQSRAVGALFEGAGFSAVECIRDLAGQPRVTRGRRV